MKIVKENIKRGLNMSNILLKCVKIKHMIVKCKKNLDDKIHKMIIVGW